MHHDKYTVKFVVTVSGASAHIDAVLLYFNRILTACFTSLHLSCEGVNE